MSDIAIRVENLSKLYHLGAVHQRPDTLRDALTGFLPRISRKGKANSLNSPNSRQASDSDDLWALKDVSFEVKRGEVVGIIGRNGAGKSTLLKILSRITEPTSGQVELHGRVGSLLEVGTGFHPELTGRENIYLNGAILGMRRHEINRQFDEIVAFAEIERFLDTPVKRYSSGMYVRLAFAVAAHLEPEILLVDEVLAVGDLAFQRKCVGIMNEIGRSGRTVLFVSHNLHAIESLCSRVLLIELGKLAREGSFREVAGLYLASTEYATYESDLSIRARPDNIGTVLRFQWIKLCDAAGVPLRSISVGQDFYVHFKYYVTETISDALVAVRIETLLGQIIVDSWDRDQLPSQAVQNGEYLAKVRVAPQDLHPGQYQISLVAAIHMVDWLDRIEPAIVFSVDPISDTEVVEPERKALIRRHYVWEREHC
jgi:lipopolysaccharide transport system ATP-binding protein